MTEKKGEQFMNNKVKNIVKKCLVGFFVLVLIVTGMALVDTGDNYVQAEENATETTNVTYAKKLITNLNDYRGEVYTYPKLDEEGKQDWIFAGWYADEACTIAYTTEQVTT